jgi:hypothetical protein
MRLATEIQGDETSTQNPARSENPSSRHSTQKHETHHEIPESRPIESAEYFALVARATNDAVRDWNVKTGTRHRLLAEADSSPGSCAHGREHPRCPRRRERSLDRRISLSTLRWVLPGLARTRADRPRFRRLGHSLRGVTHGRDRTETIAGSAGALAEDGGVWPTRGWGRARLQ